MMALSDCSIVEHEKRRPSQNLSYLNLIIKSQLPRLLLGTVHNCCITDRQKRRAIDVTRPMQARILAAGVWNILVSENVNG
jgi:hypothetical protein